MSKNVYKTSGGKIVDMNALRLANEEVVAVGNMNVNARGDEISPNGTIIKGRNQILKDRYHQGSIPGNKNKQN